MAWSGWRWSQCWVITIAGRSRRSAATTTSRWSIDDALQRRVGQAERLAVDDAEDAAPPPPPPPRAARASRGCRISPRVRSTSATRRPAAALARERAAHDELRVVRMGAEARRCRTAPWARLYCVRRHAPCCFHGQGGVHDQRNRRQDEGAHGEGGGELLDDDRLRNRGTVDETAGKIKDGVERGVDAVKDAVSGRPAGQADALSQGRIEKRRAPASTTIACATAAPRRGAGKIKDGVEPQAWPPGRVAGAPAGRTRAAGSALSLRARRRPDAVWPAGLLCG